MCFGGVFSGEVSAECCVERMVIFPEKKLCGETADPEERNICWVLEKLQMRRFEEMDTKNSPKTVAELRGKQRNELRENSG